MAVRLHDKRQPLTTTGFFSFFCFFGAFVAFGFAVSASLSGPSNLTKTGFGSAICCPFLSLPHAESACENHNFARHAVETESPKLDVRW